MIYDHPKDTCGGNGDENDEIALSFKIITSLVSETRADATPEGENANIRWPGFDDAMRKFTFFIFFDDIESKPLLFKISDTDSEYYKEKNGIYTVNLKISRADFEDITGKKIHPQSDASMKFRVVALANYGENKIPDYVNTFSWLMKIANDWKFSNGIIYEGGDMSDVITNLYHGGIPMFGMEVFEAKENNLYSSTLNQPLMLGDISMLRSVAKVCVIDNIGNRNPPTGYPRIENVTIGCQTGFGYQLPYDASNYNGKNVDLPRIPEISSGVTFNKYALGYLDRSKPGWLFGYIPEQRIEDSYPAFEITVRFSAGDGADAVKKYTVPMKMYKNQQFEFGSSVLRNHIYTLCVTSVKVNPETEDNEIWFKCIVVDWVDGGSYDLPMWGDDDDDDDDGDDDEEIF